MNAFPGEKRNLREVSMDEEKKNIIQLMLGFVRRANGDHVSAYAAQAAYFLIKIGRAHV